MLIDVKYEFGQTVFLKTDEDQKGRMVTCVQIGPGNIVTYQLSCGTGESWHFDFEISEDKDIVTIIS